MFGNFDGEYIDYYQNYPCQPYPSLLEDMYVIKLAYHCFEMLLNLLFHRHRRDFSEFLLHHIVTIVLILFSYIVNLRPVGSVVMFIMDFSDIFVAIFKMTVDVNESVQFYTFLAMMITWFYLRIWHFPIYVIWPNIQGYLKSTHPV